MKPVAIYAISVTAMVILSINCKRIEFITSTSTLELLNEHDIVIADRNSLVFDLKTCADNVFMVLANTVDIRSNKIASYYTIVFSDTISMLSVNCFGCNPVQFYSVSTAGPCNTTHELWIAWDPDGPIRIGQGHMIEERTFIDHKDGNVTDIFYASASALKPVNWSFIVEDDALEFLTPLPDGSTIITIAEDISPGTTILNITTTRPEVIITANVHGNESSQYFYVEGSALKTKKQLDFEKCQLHVIRLFTSESVFLSVKILVSDINDEAPEVVCNSTVELPEGCPVGIEITFPCTVTDADREDQYNITVEGPDSDYFRVENDTLIKMARHLDRDGEEGRNFLNISLAVMDRAGHTANRSLRLTVTDINDNYPVFTSTVYTISVTENNTKDLPVLNLTVSDLDDGNNGNITVSIHDRDANDCRFYLDGLTLTLEAGNCDYEEYEMRDQTYSLTLRSQDNPIFGSVKTAVAVVVIQIQPRNEHIPYWNISRPVDMNDRNINSGHDITVDGSVSLKTSPGAFTTENIPALNSRFTTIRDLHTATKEGSNSRNQNLTGVGNTSTFKDAPVNSVKTTTDNYNSSASFTKTQSAAKKRKARSVDRVGGMATNGSSSQYTFPVQRVSETSKIGSVVYTLNAGDMDSREHSQLTFNITDVISDKEEASSHVFGINPKSGEIFTTAPLDRDDPANGSAYFTLNVTCTDGEFTIYGTLTLQIYEVNEYPPVFERSVQSVDFDINRELYSVITNFTVTDRDQNSKISLHFRDETRQFYLQRYNLTWRLHYNTSREITSRDELPTKLIVVATDHGKPELTSTTIVVFKQAICVVPVTKTTASTTTTPETTMARQTSDRMTSLTYRSAESRGSSTTAQPECVTDRNYQKDIKNQEDREILILIIMAAVEGVIMTGLLIVTGLVVTGRLFADKRTKENLPVGESKSNLTAEKKLPSSNYSKTGYSLEECKETLPLQELGEMKQEEKDVEETDLTEGDILKTTEDSGRGSYPSINDGVITDGYEDTVLHVKD